ncbi:hypothetical protein [Kitasatospora sp. McL0602]|uniref:hypothetical protein n=1 Tax=Kitasatospora sp. McL0602 TaxID=3439530 RepID=UPI003F8A1B06
MDEQWQAPWQYGWEQQAPPPTPWEPPVTPLPSPRARRRRRWAWAATAIGGAVVLGGLLATCGASEGDPAAPVAAPSSAGPTASPSPSPSVSLSMSASATPSPGLSYDPSAVAAAPADSPAPRQSSRSGGSGSRSPRPHAAPSHRGESGTAAPQPGGPSELVPSIKVCSEAERLGQFAPGSEQAKLCHSLYGG